jgi:hypothetical protein
VVRLALGLLQYAAGVTDDDCVGGNDDGRLAALRIVDFAPVNIGGFGGRGLEYVV